VRVIERRDGVRFAFETLARLQPVGQVKRKNFDRNGTFQTSIAGAVDFPHPTGPKGCDHFIGP